MKMRHLILGDYQTNSYVLTAAEEAKGCVIVDTGLASEPLIALLKENSLNPELLILTHGHADHIGGVAVLRENFPDVKVAIHKNDADMLVDPAMNLSALAGMNCVSAPAEIIIETEEPIESAGLKFRVLHTPGHTQGGICLYCESEGTVFVGDTLFAGSIGRTDFPGGDFNQLISGIKEKLLTLPDETKVFPGHGPATTIETEKKFNQYVQ